MVESLLMAEYHVETMCSRHSNRTEEVRKMLSDYYSWYENKPRAVAEALATELCRQTGKLQSYWLSYRHNWNLKTIPDDVLYEEYRSRKWKRKASKETIQRDPERRTLCHECRCYFPYSRYEAHVKKCMGNLCPWCHEKFSGRKTFYRKHVRTCWKRPPGATPGDDKIQTALEESNRGKKIG